MESLLTPFLQLFSLLVLGFFLARKGVFTEAFNKSLATLLLRWSLPALILVSMQKEFTPDRFSGALVLLGISWGVYGLSILVALLWGRFSTGLADVKGIFQFALIFSNVGFMGFPILEALWGREILFWAAIYKIPFHFLVFTLGVYLVSGGNKDRKFHPKELLNPGLLATLAGFIAFLFSWKFPSPIHQTLTMVGGLTTPLSMILIGSLLAMSSVRRTLKTPILWGLSFIRLLVLPLAVLFFMKFLKQPPEFTKVAVIITAMPAAANLTLLATEYSPKPEAAGQMVFVSTLGALLTIPILVFLGEMVW